MLENQILRFEGEERMKNEAMSSRDLIETIAPDQA